MEQFLEELNSAITEVLSTDPDRCVAWLLSEGSAPVEVEEAFVVSVAEAVERQLASQGLLRPVARPPLAN